jgi:stearoyl-CoA desaturase (delta-9 desaturase)
MRIDRIFGHRLIMTPIASYVGLAALIYSGWALLAGYLSAWWLIALVIGTLSLLFGITVGMHRLFCHASFRTSSFWHAVLAWLATLAIYGSTVQWPAMHATHHKFSDTDRDPHYTGWRYLFWKKNRPTVFNKRVLVRLYRQPLHRFLHKYYLVVIAVSVAVLWLIDWRLLVVGYLAPLGWLHFVGSAHQVFAHGKEGPLDQRWLEWVLLTGGEWLHKWHHDHPRDPHFGKSDLGWRFIQLIQR